MRTVLLIEDNNDIRDNLCEILELSDYKVFEAGDGKEGVTLAIEHKPDIIICDIMMPVLDGYGVIHALQKNETTRNIPFIFLSAKAERTEIRKGMELGADDYITKPFSGTEVLTAIECRLRRSDLIKTELSQNIEGFNQLVSVVSSEDILQQFAESRTNGTYSKKQLIYTEGKPAFRLYYIEKGKVKTFKANDDGKELVVGLYSEGDFFGYVALMEDTPYKESAEAMEECEIAMISREEFRQLIGSNRDVMQKFIKLLARNVSDREQQLLNIAYNSLRKKVADSLMMIYSMYKGDKTNCVIDISRDNLANVAGAAKESLIRTLSDFKNEKLIDIRGGDIVILNESKLRNLIN